MGLSGSKVHVLNQCCSPSCIVSDTLPNLSPVLEGKWKEVVNLEPCLSFPMYKMEMLTIVPTSQDCDEEHRKRHVHLLLFPAYFTPQSSCNPHPPPRPSTDLEPIPSSLLGLPITTLSRRLGAPLPDSPHPHLRGPLLPRTCDLPCRFSRLSFLQWPLEETPIP